MEFSDTSNRTFYFAYKKTPWEGCSYSVETGDNGLPVVYANNEGNEEPVTGVTVTEEKPCGEYTVYKLILEDSFEMFDGRVGIKLYE